MDCHIDTFLDRQAAGPSGSGLYRATVVHTATGRALYVTWPYSSQMAALARARRWLANEYRRGESMELFEEGSRQ